VSRRRVSTEGRRPHAGASAHVECCQRDGALERVCGEQQLVEKKHADVASEPERHEKKHSGCWTRHAACAHRLRTAMPFTASSVRHSTRAFTCASMSHGYWRRRFSIDTHATLTLSPLKGNPTA
jgi:hypothetical protein